MTGDDILSRFPFHYGVYKLVRRSHLRAAIKRGWRFISPHEDGRVLMWVGR